MICSPRRRDDLPRRRHADVHRARRARAAPRARCRRRTRSRSRRTRRRSRPSLRRCCANGVKRVSLGAQSSSRGCSRCSSGEPAPDDVRRAVHTLRDAEFDNISLDLLYGIPGQSPADLESDLAEALALAPEHLSSYELEAKPGTRFTHAHGDELERQAEAMEGYFEQVVETLAGAGYRWYETANFCLGRQATATSARGTTWRYWRGQDYLASESARCRRWRAGAGGTPRPGALHRSARAVRRRRGRSRSSTRRRGRASG